MRGVLRGSMNPWCACVGAFTTMCLCLPVRAQQAEPVYAVDQLIYMLREGVRQARIMELVGNGCVLDGDGAAGQRALERAGATTALRSIIARSTCGQEAPWAGPTAAPITGRTHVVRMVGDERGYRFVPARVNAKVGDGIRFVMVSAGPHVVSFDARSVPGDVRDQLAANMHNAEYFTSPIMVNANESWTVSLGRLSRGTYHVYCLPHLAMGMKLMISIE